MNLRPLAPQASIIANLDDGPSCLKQKVKLLNRRICIEQYLKICSICHKISATDDDHLDCKEKRRVELEDEDLKQKLPEKLDLAKNPDDLGVEVRAILDHLAREKKENK